MAITKTDLIEKIVEKTGMSKSAAGEAITAVFAAITEELAKGEKVSVPGFATFEVKERAERKARNPRDGSEIIVPKCNVVGVKMAKAVKDAVNN